MSQTSARKDDVALSLFDAPLCAPDGVKIRDDDAKMMSPMIAPRLMFLMPRCVAARTRYDERVPRCRADANAR